MDVTVAVCTYGDSAWETLARTRAIPSAADQASVIHVHADSLHDARNEALDRCNTDRIIFLDADDELEAGYVDAMSTSTADIRAPIVRYTRDGRTKHARMPRVAGHRHACDAACLPEGNWIVVGACAPTQLLRDVGGWRDFPWSEDWDLWLRCHLAGATFEAVPEAVYRAHVRADSRNRAPDHAFKMAAHRAIYAANFPDNLAA